jgi:AraC-like DNA-binding protein
MSQQFWRDPLLPFVESRSAWRSRACYRPHTHPTLSIGAVDAGRSVLQVAGREDQLLEAGDVVLISARCVHACNPAPESPWSYQMLYLDADWVATLQAENLIKAPDLPPRRPVHFRDAGCYRQFCELNMLLFDVAPAEMKEEALIGFVGSLLLEPDPESEVVPPWVLTLADRLSRHCGHNWSTCQLASEVGVSRFHLIRVFKRWMGLTPHAYQTDCRINAARQLMREGFPLVELALRLGFSDQSHFQRAFRQRVSMTPGDYQRQMKP